MSEKYTWDNAGDLKQLSVRIIGAIIRQFFFHMVTHVFDNPNLSQEIFAIGTWRAVIYSGTWSQTQAYDPSDYMESGLIVWSPYSRNNRRTCLQSCSKEGFNAVKILFANISCETRTPAIITTM